MVGWCAAQFRPKTGAMVLYLIIIAVCCLWIFACVQEAVCAPISSSRANVYAAFDELFNAVWLHKRKEPAWTTRCTAAHTLSTPRTRGPALSLVLGVPGATPGRGWFDSRLHRQTMSSVTEATRGLRLGH